MCNFFDNLLQSIVSLSGFGRQVSWVFTSTASASFCRECELHTVRSIGLLAGEPDKDSEGMQLLNSGHDDQANKRAENSF
jgi:hypothetical protein